MTMQRPENRYSNIKAWGAYRSNRVRTSARDVCVGLLAFAGAASAFATAGKLNAAYVSADPHDLTGVFLTGVNLAGAGFGKLVRKDGTKAKHGDDYLYPVSKFASGYSPQYFLSKGMTSFRLSFLWERLEPRLGSEFDTKEFFYLRESVRELTERGAWVILDLHNYARYEDVKIGEGKVAIESLTSTWKRLAAEFSSNPKVIFGLMNEPYDISNRVWVKAVNASIAAIRDQGSRNYILVAGNGYSAAQNWGEAEEGGSNAVALLAVRDPLDRSIFEAHTYLDRKSSGTERECVSAQTGVDRLKPFTDWLKVNKKRGFIGEFGAGISETCLAGLSNLARYVKENRDVYLGWSYWAAGPKWPSDWMYLIEPINGQDAPQMVALSAHLQ